MKKGFPTNLSSSFGDTYRKKCDVGMKWRALKSKKDYSFRLSGKRRKGFSNINNSVKSYLQKWIIYHPNLIQSPIENDYITVKFDDGN